MVKKNKRFKKDLNMPTKDKKLKQPLGKGVRELKIEDSLPKCDIIINKSLYSTEEICKNKKVIDIGCGYGRNKKIIEDVGGEWIGIEPFEGGEHTVIGSAEKIPFDNNTFDVVIMDAVLEHVQDVGKAFKEVSRVLKPNGEFIGYVAFMECFHEISYSHLSFKALEYYSEKNNMKLSKISGGSRFGIDYHLAVLLYPIPFNFGRKVLSSLIRMTFKLKSYFGFLGLFFYKGMKFIDAKALSTDYYKLEVLRQSNGFNFIIKKNI